MEKTKFKDNEGRPFADNVGPIIQGLLNGVKQTTETFASKYDIDLENLNAVIKGEKGPTEDILEAINKHSPIRIRDLYDLSIRDQFPVRDDTKDGVIVFDAKQRDATIRTLSRGPKEGKQVPFYDYGDTAMSTTSLFRPEWIQELYSNDGENSDFHDWAFNKGHFEHQMTFFIGTVNFHWRDTEGKKYVQKMNTGDMNYNTPFVPHTFTTREEGNGLILAVTFGGAIATEEFQATIKSMDYGEYLARIKEEVPKLEKGLATEKLNGVMINRHSDSPKEARE